MSATDDTSSLALDALLGAAPSLARRGDEAPQARVLSNGRTWALASGSGGGFVSVGAAALTRFAADRTTDGDGVFLYLRDAETGEAWSLGASPMGATAGSSLARAFPGVVRLTRSLHGIEASCEIAVAAEADAEVRTIALRNRSARARRIEVTVCAELVVGSRDADLAHPAFAKLFVETSFDAGRGVVSARRRPRASDEKPLWAAAALAGEGALEVETSRAEFLGRGASSASPAALARPLSGTAGSVLDPVAALRRTVELAPGATASLGWALAGGEERDVVEGGALAVAASAEAAVAAAGKAEKARLRACGLDVARGESANAIAAAMLYGHPALLAGGANGVCGIDVPHAAAGADGTGDAAGAAASGDDAEIRARLGIAPDALLVVARLTHEDNARLRALAPVASYFAALAFGAAVLVLCSDADCDGASCPLAEAAAASRGGAPALVLASARVVGERDVASLVASARWLVGSAPPALESDRPEPSWPRRPSPRAAEEALERREELRFDNGYGGFAKDGKEYVVRVGPAGAERARPPMPWANVIANPGFGCLVSESGAGYTWAANSRQNKLTPWSNDPVADPHHEALYLRDHASGRVWSPLPGPAPSGAWTEVRHGFGYTTWRQRSEAIEQEVTTFVDAEAPVRFVRVRLHNRGSRARSLSLYSLQRLVLGVLPAVDARHVVTEWDEAAQTLLAHSPRSLDHGEAVAFAAVVDASDAVRASSWTADRASFLGRGGREEWPLAPAIGEPLDARAGEGLDPCLALETRIELAPRGRCEVAVLFGQAASRAEATELVARFGNREAIEASLAAAREFWSETLGAIEVRTPSESVDLLLGGWLLYQTLACRLWARSAFYQSGGAFGFRDQLQDSTALAYARPDLTRAQLLLHASHQFAEGDVQHWWHPPASRGTRTRFADDLVWLPYLAAWYVGATGDESVLDERVPFVSARTLADGEDEAYLAATASEETASVYEHCCRALDRSLTSGSHGLPLMGSGDWNDGMNRIGRRGCGESVWMAFFLAAAIDAFAPLVEKRADWERLRNYRRYREALPAAVEAEAWDGSWYRRAYDDDGRVVGSAASEECRIDALVQAWSVLSGVAPAERAKQAMDAVEEQLVDEEAGIVRLLWPPFDRTDQDPGYIKGYVPGIRENGGQYTHAAVWTIRALAELGRVERAWQLFEMISPATHGGDAARVERYRVEPYVVAADIYGAPPHSGRGGWTWYTGSAAWMYRTVLETLLGLTIEQGRLLRLRPRIPHSWPGFTLTYRLPDRRTRYAIEVVREGSGSGAVTSATIDGQPAGVDKAGARIVLRRDGKAHKVRVTLA